MVKGRQNKRKKAEKNKYNALLAIGTTFLTTFIYKLIH